MSHLLQLRSSLYLLRGKIHEAMDNRIPAIEDYKTSLKLDVCCNEAFELLVRHEMLTPDEGIKLKAALGFFGFISMVIPLQKAACWRASRLKNSVITMKGNQC